MKWLDMLLIVLLIGMIVAMLSYSAMIFLIMRGILNVFETFTNIVK
jgi:hypothetical protein